MHEVSVDELADRIAEGAVVIDVREPAEYDEARVPGVTLIPLGTIPDHIDDFRNDGVTYVICRSGGRSLQACEFVAAQGADVANVAGGTLAWIASGRDVASGAS
ncbi:MAG: rhodanese-like domain-containing protein [Ilumatobacteraceae bacterium]